MIHAIGMLLIFLLMLPNLADLWVMGNTASQQRVAADHLRMVVQGARSYVNRHQDTLLAQTGASSGPTVTIQTLVNEGFLPAGFSEHNIWLQNYSVYVRQPETGRHQEGAARLMPRMPLPTPSSRSRLLSWAAQAVMCLPASSPESPAVCFRGLGTAGPSTLLRWVSLLRARDISARFPPMIPQRWGRIFFIAWPCRETRS